MVIVTRPHTVSKVPKRLPYMGRQPFVFHKKSEGGKQMKCAIYARVSDDKKKEQKVKTYTTYTKKRRNKK